MVRVRREIWREEGRGVAWSGAWGRSDTPSSEGSEEERGKERGDAGRSWSVVAGSVGGVRAGGTGPAGIGSGASAVLIPSS